MHKKFFILALLIFLLSGYCSHASTTQVKPPQGIILISLDTLRADHLGIYGYHRSTSPSIDAFAREGVVFENAVAHAPTTLPSHMSIMTSLYPAFHGVREGEDEYLLADEHVTLAELLRHGGYQTAAFVDGGWMRAVFGFAQGFDIYDDQRGGIAKILPKAKKWLNKHKSEPFFLFIHCYDIHSPYAPPPPYDTIFHDFIYNGHLSPSNENLMPAARNALQVNDDDIRHFIALYDGGIRYTDEKIGEFLSYLRESGVADQSLIIITSDHGEEFKEHGSFLHWQLYYRPDLNVPLIMHIPRYPRKEIRIAELVRSIDLLPTIVDFAGLPEHPEAQGKSLFPLIRRNKNFLRRFLWGMVHVFKRKSHISFAENKNSNSWSIISDGYQLVNESESHSPQLFKLKADPLAQNDTAKENEALVERLLLQSQERYNVTPQYKSSPITLDAQTREQLKELGYIE